LDGLQTKTLSKEKIELQMNMLHQDLSFSGVAFDPIDDPSFQMKITRITILFHFYSCTVFTSLSSR